MFALIAMLTRRGLVLRALAATAFIGAAACHDANGPLAPTQVGDASVTGLPKDGDVPVAGSTEEREEPVIQSEAAPGPAGAPAVAMRAQVREGRVGALSCTQPQAEGRWENQAPSHEQFLSRINLRFVCQDRIINGQPYPPGSPWYVQAFRKGSPTDYDWGEVSAWETAYGSWQGWIYAYYDQRFNHHRERHIYAKWISPFYGAPYLEVWIWTDFEPGYGNDYWRVERFNQAAQPDLIVESLTHTPANPTTADVITFTAVVKNVGNARADASQMRFVLGGDPNRYVQAPTFGVPELAPGQAYTVERQLQVSAPGTYSIDATADVRNAVAESNEKNNMQTGDYTVTAPPGAPPVIRRAYPLTNFAARIEWVPPQGASGFHVYRVGPYGQRHRLTAQPISGGACLSKFGEDPTDRCFTDLILVPGFTYSYSVAAKYSDKSDGLSESVSVTLPLTPVTADQAAQMLKDLGYAVDQAAQMLRDLGYAIGDIARALRPVYQPTADQAAQMFKNLGYAIGDIASVLQSVYHLTAQQAAQTLKNLGYAIHEIASVLQSVFHQTAHQLAGVLKALGYGAGQVAQVLHDLGSSLGQIIDILRSWFSLGLSTLKDILLAIGFGLGAVLKALGLCFFC
jgi:CARDB protein